MSRALQRFAPIVLVSGGVSLLAGCGGSRAAVVPRHVAGVRATVTFTMHWAHRPTAGSRRRPLFLSPSAQSVVVEVNAGSSPAGPVTFANAPATSGTPAATTIAVDAPPGTDDFSIALFDSPQTPGETAPVGTQLGRAEVTQTIVPGTTNTLDAVVSGIVGGVRVTPAANQPFVETLSANAPQAYALVGDQPETFVVTAVDPGGNVIVPVDTSAAHVDTPAVALAPSPVTSELSVAATADPSRFVVSVNAAKGAPTLSLALLGSASDGAGDRAQTNISVDERSAVYLSVGGGAPGIVVFDDRGNRIALASGAFAGLSNPGALAYDQDDHRVFVADGGAIAAFDAAGGAVSGFSTPAVPAANGIAYDSADKLIYVSAPGTVKMFAPNGAAPASVPASFAAAHANAIAFVASTTPMLAVANADPVTPSFDLYAEDGTPAGTFPIGGAAAPLAVACDPSGPTVYVATASTLGAFDLSGSSLATVADSHAPAAAAFDGNLGELHVLDVGTGALPAYLGDLSAVDPAHAIAAFATGSHPQGVTVAF